MEIYNEFTKLRGNSFTTAEYVNWLELQVLKLRAALKLAEAGRITGGQAVASEVCPCCGGAKVDKDIHGFANNNPCAVCNGTGKL